MADSIEHTRLDRIRPAVIEAFKQRRAPEVEAFDTQPLAQSSSAATASSTLNGNLSNEYRKLRLVPNKHEREFVSDETLSVMRSCAQEQFVLKVWRKRTHGIRPERVSRIFVLPGRHDIVRLVKD